MSKSVIVVSWGRLIPNFLRNQHTYFQSDSNKQWRSLFLTPHLVQNKLELVVLILGLLTSIRWHLRVIFICISWWLKLLIKFWSIFWPFAILVLRILCLNLYFIFWLNYLVIWCLIFWVIYVFCTVWCGVSEDLFSLSK